jgi:hypothetical protein
VLPRILSLLLTLSAVETARLPAQLTPDSIKYRVTPTVDSTAPGRIYVPQDLEDALRELNHMLSPAFVIEFRADSAAPMKAHFGLGLWMRNNWGLWAGSRLSRYFNCQGIFHPDDMSGIILTSYWRQLNGRPIDLRGQIAEYHDYWRKEGVDSTQLRPQC